MSELSPAQLDALEDALEGLEAGGGFAGFADPVADRLSEYREILTLSREAFPLVDVRAGVLDGVLAQARAAAVVPEAAIAPPSAQDKPWWQRISLFVPILAVAGSAALVLIIVGPLGSSPSPAMEEVARAPGSAAPAGKSSAAAAEALADDQAKDRADDQVDDQVGADRSGPVLGREGQLADGSIEERRGRLQRESGDALRGEAAAEQDISAAPQSGLLGSKAGEDVDPAAANSATADEPITEERTIEEKSKGTASKAPTGSGASTPAAGAGSRPSGNAPAKPKPAPAPAPEPAPPPAPKNDAKKKEQPTPGAPADVGEGGMAVLVAADRSRHAAECVSAIKQYATVRKSSNASIRARALAGIGLCELADGHVDAAETLFRQARAADAKVASFIAAERRLLAPDQASENAADDQASVEQSL